MVKQGPRITNDALMYLPNFVAEYHNISARSIRKQIADASVASESSMLAVCMGTFQPSPAVVGWFEVHYPQATAKYFDLTHGYAFRKRDFDWTPQRRAEAKLLAQRERMKIAENCKHKIVDYFEKGEIK